MMHVKEGIVSGYGWEGSTAWRVGNPVHRWDKSSTLTIEADGHELQLILQAMKGSSKERAKIDPKQDKILAIKALKTFCEDTFGATAGLKQSKDCIESVIEGLAPKGELFQIGDRFNHQIGDMSLPSIVFGIWVVLSIDNNSQAAHPQLVTLIHANTGKIEQVSGFWLNQKEVFDKLPNNT